MGGRGHYSYGILQKLFYGDFWRHAGAFRILHFKKHERLGEEVEGHFRVHFLEKL
jgi:hypothetical protein